MHPSMQPASPLLPQYEAPNPLVRLSSWPNLPRIQSDAVQEVAQICALLAIRPTATGHIPQVLDLPVELVEQIVETLFINGHLAESGPEDGTEQVAVQPSQIGVGGQGEPLLTRLWKRMTSLTRH